MQANPQTKAEIMAGIENVVSSKKIANNTIQYKLADGTEVIRLHNTNIFTKYKNGRIVLNTDGWLTPTTKDRLNNYTDALMPKGYKLGISQKDKKWTLTIMRFKGTTEEDLCIDGVAISKYTRQHWETVSEAPFVDGIEIYRGRIPNKFIKKAEVNQKALAKSEAMIQKYLSKCKKTFQTEGVPYPDGGDCWYCLMFERDQPFDGKVLKHNDTNNHIVMHMKEGYIHGAIIYNALTEAGLNAGHYMYMANQRTTGRNYEIDTIIRSMRKYLRRRLGVAI